MKTLFLVLLLCPALSHASFLINYGLNYSSEKDTTTNSQDYDKKRTFHKIFLGASVNGRKTLYFGWNVNSWSSSLKAGTAAESKYSSLEMGPAVLWYLNDNFNWYLTAVWSPYAKGTRNKGGTSRDFNGSNTGFGLGYRFKLSGAVGLGASIQYQTLSLKEEKVGSASSNVSDKVTHLMPMLELSFLTK